MFSRIAIILAVRRSPIYSSGNETDNNFNIQIQIRSAVLVLIQANGYSVDPQCEQNFIYRHTHEYHT